MRMMILDKAVHNDEKYLARPNGVADGIRWVASHLPTGKVSAWPDTTGATTLQLVEPGPSSVSRGALGTGVEVVVFPGGGPAGRRLIGPDNTDAVWTLALIALTTTTTSTGIAGVHGGSLAVDSSGYYTVTIGGQTVTSTVKTTAAIRTIILWVDSSGYLHLRVGLVETVSSGTVTAPTGTGTGVFLGPDSATAASFAEVTYWPRALTDTERSAVWIYARDTYNAS